MYLDNYVNNMILPQFLSYVYFLTHAYSPLLSSRMIALIRLITSTVVSMLLALHTRCLGLTHECLYCWSSVTTPVKGRQYFSVV
jgi:hypothetical protein